MQIIQHLESVAFSAKSPLCSESLRRVSFLSLTTPDILMARNSQMSTEQLCVFNALHVNLCVVIGIIE